VIVEIDELQCVVDHNKKREEALSAQNAQLVDVVWEAKKMN
jgi:hypothetical protein